MPNVLDDNVIILRFENQNFEKNVEASASALEKLNKSIEDSTATKANFDELARSVRNIDVSHLADGIETASRRFKTLGVVGASVINKLTNDSLSKFIDIGKKLPQTIIQGGWKRALNIEQAEFLIEGLGYKFEGTFDKTTKAFTGIKGAVLASVDDTRYGLDEAAKVASQLMASGITEVDTLAARLKAISGLASVTNSEFSDIGRIFSQVAGQGRMMGDDLLQISERGINAAAKIKDYLNANEQVRKQAIETAIAQGNQKKKMEAISKQAELSEADIRDMVSAGAISFDVMAASFEDFFKQAVKANDTYEGSLANVRAALSRMGAQVESVKLKNMTAIFNTLLPVLKRFEDFIEPVTSKINEMSTAVTDFINENIINKIGQEIGLDAKDLFHRTAEAIEETGDASKKTGEDVKDLGDKLKVSKEEWQAALDIWYKGTYGNGQARKNAITELGMSYENVQGIINKFYKNGFDWEKTRKEYETESTESTKENTEAIEENVEAVVEQQESLSGLGKVVTGVINLVKTFLNIVKGGIKTVVAIKNAFSGLGGSLLDTLGTALLFISDKILALSRTFANTMRKIANNGKGFKTLIDQGNIIARTFKMINTVANILASGLDKVTKTIVNFYKAISTAKKEAKSGEKNISSLAKVFKSFNNISKSFTNFFKGLGNIVKIVAGYFKSLKIEFNGFGKTGIGEFLSGVGERLADWFLKISEKVLKLSERFVKFTETIIAGGEEADKLVGKGTNLGKVIDKFKNIGSSIKESFKTIGSTISSKTFSAFDKIENTFRSIKNTLSDFSGGSIIVGTFMALSKAVSNFLSGLATGQRTAGSFFSTIGSALNKVLGIVSQVFGWLIDKTGPAFDKIIDFFKQLSESEGFEKLKDALSKLVDSMTDMASSGFGTVVGWFKDLANIAFSGGSLNNVVNFFSTLAGSIGTFIDKINKGENPFTGFFDSFKKIREMMSIKFQLRDSVGAKFSDALNAPAIATSLAQFKKLDVGGKTLKASTTLIDFVNKLSDGFNAAALKGGLDKYLKELKEADLDKLSGLALKIVSVVGIIKSVKDMSSLIDSFVGVGKSISGFFNSLGGIADSISKSIKIEAFRTIAIAIGILIASIVALAAVPTDRLIPALIGVGTLLGSLVFIITLMNKPTFDPRKLMDIGIAFLGIGAGVFLLAKACTSLSKIEPAAMFKAAAVIVAFMAAFVIASRLAGTVKSAGVAFMAMAVAVNLLVGAILLFAMMPWATFIAGAKCVAIVIGILAVAARIAGTGAKGSVAFFAMAVALYALIPAIILMALIPRDKAIQGAATISGVLIALGVAAKIAGAAKAGIKTMASMAGVIAVLTASLVVLSFINPEALFHAVSSLVIVMGVLAGAGSVAKSALTGIWSIAAVIAVLTGCIAALIAMDPTASLQIALSLSALALALGGACAIFAAINPVGAISAVVALGVFIAGLLGIMKGLAYISEKTDMQSHIEKSKEILKSIGEALGSFFGGAILGATEDLPEAAENLKQFTDVLIPALDSLSKLAEKKDSIQALKELAEAMLALTGGGVLDKVSSAIGGGETTDFSKFGASLTDLAKSFVPFGKAVDEGLTDDSIEKVKKVGEAVNVFANIAAALPKEGGVWQDVAGTVQGVDDFADSLKSVPKAMSKMAENAADFTDEDIAQVSKVGKAVSIMSEVAAALPKGTTFMSAGVAQMFTGYSNLKIFAEQLADFVPGFKKFTDACGAVGDESTFGNLSRVKNVAAAVSVMAEAAASIPTGMTFMSGGVKHLFSGTSSLSSFAEQLADFVPGFKKFSDACAAVGDDSSFGNLSRVKNVAAAVSVMAEAANSIPKGMTFTTGGFKQMFTGSASLTSFAKQLSNFVKPFKSFTDQLVENPIDTSVLNQIPSISTALKSIGDMAKSLPNTGGAKGFFFGNKDIGSFSKGIAELAKGIGGFAKNMQGIDLSGAEIGKEAAAAINSTLTSLNGIGAIKTYNNLPKVAENIASFVSTMSSVDVTGISGKASKIASAAKSLAKVASTSLKNSTKNSGGDSVGSSIASDLVKGIKSKASAVASAARNLGSKAVSGAKSGASGMYSGGANVGQGFVNGIKAKETAAYRAGYNLGKAAKRGQAAATGEGSPAKEFIKGGKYAAEGLVIGLKAYEHKVYKAGYSLAAQSVNAANEANDLFDVNFNPVITPVVDLTNIQNGAKQINNMMSSAQAVDINARVNSAPTRYETSSIVDKMLDKFNDMTLKSLDVTVKNSESIEPSTNYFTFNVDGAENPEDFAQRFVRQVQLELRTG